MSAILDQYEEEKSALKEFKERHYDLKDNRGKKNNEHKRYNGNDMGFDKLKRN